MEKIASMFASKKRPSESKDETERESKRANTEETKTVWAFVLEEDEWDSTKYKIAIDLAEYPCERNVGNLEKAVKFETERMGFNVPARTRIYRDNPFQESSDDIYGDVVLHLKPNLRYMRNNVKVVDDDRDDSRPFYVLVSKLEKRQPSMELGAPPLQNVPSTVMPAATLETIEEIFQTKLHSYTVRLRLRRLEDIERFRLPDNHPFAARVNQLDIPAYPIRAKDAMPTPHLIMDGLVQHGQGVRFLTPHQRNKLQNLIETGAFAMMGVSGSGKTRTIMELLAEMWGLLFVVDTQHNGGIKDFGALATHLDSFIKDPARRSLSKAPFTLSDGEAAEWAFNEQERIRKDNDPIAIHALNCVLLARLLILDSCLQQFGEQMNPTTWLWIQLYPGYMLQSDEIKTENVFMNFFYELLDIPQAVVAKGIRARMESVVARLGLSVGTALPCFVDEAQILFTQFSGCFSSHEASLENNIGRSLFSVALRAFSYNVQGPVFAGTGMRLQEATDALASAAMGKHPGSEGRVYADLPSLKGDACVQYLSRYLDLDMVAPRDRDAIVRVVSGRARASARYVGEVLIKDTVDLMEVLRFVIDKLTHPVAVRTSPKESLYVMLDKLFVKLRSRPEYDAIRATFRRMIATYAITGQPQRFPENDVDGRVAVQFIEEGICRVSKDTTSGLVAVIDEQLVLIAACNYFNLHSYQWEMLAYSADEPSSLGFQFERSLALLIESGLITLFSSDSPPLEEHPLLKHRLEVPPAFRGKWRLDTSRGPEAGFVIGRAATDDYTLADWIVNPTSVFFFPDKHAGPDIVFFVVNEDGQRALVPLQSKLVNTRLKSSETSSAADTTDVNKFYKFGNGKAIATRSQQRAAIMEFYESENLLSIGLLLSYPAGAAGAHSMVRYENRDLFIAACGEDFKLLVPRTFAERIAFMKN